jgi:hypothetical protein
MLSQWNKFQENFPDFIDFGASCKLLEHYNEMEPAYASSSLKELVKILFNLNLKMFCKGFSVIFATLVNDARRTERIEGVTKKLLEQLQELAVAKNDGDLVSRTVTVILKYVFVDLGANDNVSGNPLQILDCLHSLVQPVSTLHCRNL